MSTVSTASITGMVFSFIISIALPIVLLIVVKRKTNAKVSGFFMGVLTFVVFALILEQFLHLAVNAALGDTLTSNIWLYALYGGLAAGIFEETGRFLTMRFFMKKNLTKENALMYGVGHGGIEAMLIAGLAALSNIIIAFLVNAGQIDIILSTLDDTARATAMNSISQLWTLPSYLFYMPGVERISAIFVQIALSYFVYRAVKDRKIRYYGIAVLLHALVDIVAVVANSYLPVPATEAIIFMLAVVLTVAAYRMYRSEVHEKTEI